MLESTERGAEEKTSGSYYTRPGTCVPAREDKYSNFRGGMHENTTSVKTHIMLSE